MTAGRPLLSAAIIARNESRFIGACLGSLRGVADEVVVVDTGSTDETPDIARAHGARLATYPWDGNFSNARNRALDLVTGDWVLYIDCDEQVVSAESDLDAVRRVLETDDDAVAYRVLFVSRVGNTPYREYRIWRNRPDIRFRGVIHETMVPDLTRISRDEGMAIRPIPLTLHHFGYEGDQRHKHERNLPMLLEQVQLLPRRVYLWWHLGVVYTGLGRPDDALSSWARGVQIVREDGLKSPTDLIVYCELAYQLALRGEPVDDLVREGLAHDPHCWSLHVAALVTAHRERRFDDVDRGAARLLAAGREGVQDDMLGYPRSFFTSVPLKALAESRWERGDLAGAAEAFAELVALEPDNLEYRTKAAATAAAAARGVSR